jgi:hypothetical protein
VRELAGADEIQLPVAGLDCRCVIGSAVRDGL